MHKLEFASDEEEKKVLPIPMQVVDVKKLTVLRDDGKLLDTLGMVIPLFDELLGNIKRPMYFQIHRIAQFAKLIGCSTIFLGMFKTKLEKNKLS